ncbi:MAG TPA: M28 family peptidase [Pyrinomonadaceae bacterium]|nr:M28 family peptidase [Pyrinomonadaceae bacterium]
MKYKFIGIGLVLFALASLPASAQRDLSALLDGTKMKERVKILSADEFEGRGPGSEGSKKAADYIVSELKAAGVNPGNGNSYFQNVRLVGVKVDPATLLTVTPAKGEAVCLKFGDDFVATTGAQRSGVSVDAELVFAGYGIESPLYKWNDYNGPAADYRGKVLLIMVNDPPATEAEPNLFGGKALTYYGRWTYKYEEAARRGAAGVILIHSTDSAGYGWNVVRTSFGGPRSEIERAAGDKTPYLDLMSWATEDAVRSMLKSGGLDLDELRKKASVRGFKPVKTGLRVKIGLDATISKFESPNIVGVIPGRDAKLKDQYVIYTAHWDHLGMGEADADGDRIYNGAYDNASGVSAVIEIANAINGLKGEERPRRSSYFLFPAAEEQGLLGAEYFAQKPLIPLNKIAGNVNIDGVNFFGRTKDFSALGSERSTVGEVVDLIAKQRDMTLEGDMRPDQGFFFRSDHFPFAKMGVPAISLRHGDDFVKPLEGEALNFFSNYTAKYYHQTTDEYYDWWDGDAMVQNAELGLAIGLLLANLDEMPRYLKTDEFADADQKRMGK